jgi:iron(III) transport system permease protein
MRWLGYGALWLAVLLLVAAPVGSVLWGGCDPFLFAEILRHPVYRAALFNSLMIAVLVTSGCLVLAVPLAWWAWRWRFPGRGLAEALLLGPLILPPFVGALGVFQLCGHYGILNTLGTRLGWWALGGGPDWLGDHRLLFVVLVEILGLYPILYLTVAASLSRLDPATLEAAAVVGAGRGTIFRRIVLPQIRPGLLAGGAVVFVWAFTELGTPLMLAYDRVAPVVVFNGLADLSQNRLPLALVVIMLALALSLYALGRWAAGREADNVVVKGAAGDATITLTGWRAVLAWVPFLAVAVSAAAPHLGVVLLGIGGDWYRSLLPAGVTSEHYRAALAHPAVVPAIINSVVYSGLATVLAVGLGLALAWVAVRWRPPGSRLLDAAAMIPLAVPGLIMAFGFLALAVGLSAAIPALKPWLDPQLNPGPVLVVAYAVRRLPHALRAVSAGLAQAPVALEEAAATCGAGPLTRLRRITMPLIAGSLAAGAILTFSASMLEVSDSLILAQSRAHWPVTKVIYDLVGVLGPGAALACAFATWAMLFLAACLAAAAVFMGKGPATLFRT